MSHLIDRESELAILRRLARQHIGPRLLGTFSNGRFEQYYNAKPLTAADLRRPETSFQVAKRMRELHDGIALLEEERDAGPCVWRNWDRWVTRCEDIVGALDRKVKNRKGALPTACVGEDEGRKIRQYVCGTEWHVFKRAVNKYRDWLMKEVGGERGITDRLVFAHNDVSSRFMLFLSLTSILLFTLVSHGQRYAAFQSQSYILRLEVFGKSDRAKKRADTIR